MISFLQVNLHRSPIATNLLYATAASLGDDVLIISEQARGPQDDLRRASCKDKNCGIILTRSANFSIERRGSGSGFCWIQTGNLVVYSCYFPPGRTLQEFIGQIEGLEHSIRLHSHEVNLILAGDFNSKSYHWGSNSEDDRGTILAEMTSSIGFTSANVGHSPTFRRGNAESVIDITFERLHFPHRIQDWQVLDEFTHSDHRYISFKLAPSLHSEYDHSELNHDNQMRNGWSCRKLDQDKLIVFLQNTPPPFSVPDASAEEAASLLEGYLKSACDSCMPRKPPALANRKPVFWWSDEIAVLRRKCKFSQRIYQRDRRRRDLAMSETHKAEYQQARKALKIAILTAKEKSWSKLCEAVENDPWGLPYRLVTKKLSTHPPGIEAKGREKQIAEFLFPPVQIVDWNQHPLPPERNESNPSQEIDEVSFTGEELATAAYRLPAGKACGVDGIPNELLRRVAFFKPSVLMDTFNSCLRQRKFPAAWKEARLVLLHKGPDKPVDAPSSFRPISLLNTAGKTLERLILSRLNRHLSIEANALSEFQYGFRVGRSTEDAIKTVLNFAEEAGRGPWQYRDICVMVLLDVQNAFNSAPWVKIDSALERKKVPNYLREMIRSYLSDRKVVTGAGSVMPVTCGVPQGSVIGPALWNVFYDDLIRISKPEGIQIVAYADDVAILARARDSHKLEEKINPVLEVVNQWMACNGLTIAPAKSEAILLTTKNKYDIPEIKIGGHRVEVKKSVRYLGIELDQRMNFTSHVARASKAAADSARAIGRLMPNYRGPKNGKRRLLMSVVQSKLLYGVSVWAEKGLKTAKNRAAMDRPLRMAALRIIRGYRTVSDVAALMLARIPPSALLIKEHLAVRARKSAVGDITSLAQIKSEEKLKTVQRWQEIWNTSTKGAWTRKILPDLRRWYDAKVAPSYQLTQALTGHGCFRKYLFSKKRASSPFCVYCMSAEDDALHTIFECPHWDNERLPVGQFCGGRNPMPEDVQDLLCGPDLPEDLDVRRRAELLHASSRATKAFLSMVDHIISCKENDERLLQLNNGDNY